MDDEMIKYYELKGTEIFWILLLVIQKKNEDWTILDTREDLSRE